MADPLEELFGPVKTPEAAPPLQLEGSGGAWIAIQVNPAV